MLGTLAALRDWLMSLTATYLPALEVLDVVRVQAAGGIVVDAHLQE